MPNLLRYREFAVDHYSGIPCALHLRHARQSLNLGKSKGAKAGGSMNRYRRVAAFRMVILLVVIVCFSSCAGKENASSVEEGGDRHGRNVFYAERFSITRLDDGSTLIQVKVPKGERIGIEYTYLLVPDDKAVPEYSGDARVIRTPLKSVTCETGFQVTLIGMLDSFDAIKGVSGKRRVGHDRVHRMIDKGELAVTGFMRGLNMETLLKFDPDLSFVNVTSVSTDIFEEMIAYGLKPGFFCASLEKHPLGALEWIKFVGAFFEKDSLAAAIFEEKEQAYLDVLKTVRDIDRKPSVIAGYSRKGAWSTMGSSRWFVAMLDHAGGDYMFKERKLDRGHILSHEVAMDAGMQADFWVNTHFRVTDLDGLLQEDERYGLFRCFRNQRVYNNNNYRFKNGRNRFWDEGMTEPHFLLEDLISIFHPDILPDHTLKYYRHLQ